MLQPERRLLLAGVFALFAERAFAQFGTPSIPGLPQLPGSAPARPSTGGGGSGGGGSLSQGDIGSGLKQALRQGSDKAIGSLGRRDGFYKNPDARIGLPSSIARVQPMLRTAGLGGTLDDLELRMNRGAEAAVPKAATLFRGAIEGMSWSDARAILQGPDDSATKYLREKTGQPLKRDMMPIVGRELEGAGASKVYDGVMAQAGPLGAAAPEGGLSGWVTGEAMDALFALVGREEASIRKNPAARGTDLMKKVFG